MNCYSQTRSRQWLGRVLVAAALLTCLRVWIGPLPTLETAQAQIPDSGLQRKLLLDEAQRTNQLLTEIRDLLAKPSLNARPHGADNKSGSPPSTKSSGP